MYVRIQVFYYYRYAEGIAIIHLCDIIKDSIVIKDGESRKTFENRTFLFNTLKQ